MNIIEKLNWRYACKVFDKEKKISDKNLDILLESLRLSASSFGLQPWTFVVVRNQEKRNELVAHSWGQSQVADASHLILLCQPKNIDDQFVDDFVTDIANKREVTLESLEGYSNMMKGFISRKNDEQKAAWMRNQVYIALGSLLVTAATLEIDTCPMEGIIPKKYDEVLGLDSLNLTTVLACPVGYRSQDDKYATTKKVRYDSSKMIKFID